MPFFSHSIRVFKNGNGFLANQILLKQQSNYMGDFGSTRLLSFKMEPIKVGCAAMALSSLFTYMFQFSMYFLIISLTLHSCKIGECQKLSKQYFILTFLVFCVLM